MKIEHVSLRTRNLERMKHFYETYLRGRAGEKYINPRKNFESYFLEFEGGCRLELIEYPDSEENSCKGENMNFGYVHVAFSVGSESEVDRITTLLQSAGYPLLDGPRTTGDGYYESVVRDPEGNKLEITV